MYFFIQKSLGKFQGVLGAQPGWARTTFFRVAPEHCIDHVWGNTCDPDPRTYKSSDYASIRICVPSIPEDTLQCVDVRSAESHVMKSVDKGDTHKPHAVLSVWQCANGRIFEPSMHFLRVVSWGKCKRPSRLLNRTLSVVEME